MQKIACRVKERAFLELCITSANMDKHRLHVCSKLILTRLMRVAVTLETGDIDADRGRGVHSWSRPQTLNCAKLFTLPMNSRLLIVRGSEKKIDTSH